MENDFKMSYMRKVQLEIGKVRREIDNKKETFKSTNWTDEKSMIEAANEIWRMEKRLKDALEIHSIICENLEGEEVKKGIRASYGLKKPFGE